MMFPSGASVRIEKRSKGSKMYKGVKRSKSPLAQLDPKRGCNCFVLPMCSLSIVWAFFTFLASRLDLGAHFQRCEHLVHTPGSQDDPRRPGGGRARGRALPVGQIPYSSA